MEFVVPIGSRDIVQRSSSQISSLFNGVRVQLLSTDENQQWLKLCGDETEQGKEAVQNAREYIKALCCPEVTQAISGLTISASDLSQIAKNYSVEATVSRDQKFILKGSAFNVTLAKSWIEKEYENTSAKTSSADDLLVGDTPRVLSCKKFVIKLGYREEDVEFAARTLGPGLDKNKLLQELVYRTRSSVQTERKKPADIVPRGFVTMSSEGEIPTTQHRSVVEVPRSTSRHEYALADGRVCEASNDGIVARSWKQSSKAEISGNSLRPVIIDASNVAMHHGNHQVFSCLGIELSVKWFQARGHKEVFALVPRWRTETPRTDYPISDQQLLLDMAKQGVVQFTPSRQCIDGKNIVCYDDRFIVELAHKLDGVIVSNDGYRDLLKENLEWKDVIEKRLVMFSFVRDIFMVPDDPLGRYGPTLKQLLRKGTTARHSRVCPFIGRCTYKEKCRFYHPDRDVNRRPQELIAVDIERQYKAVDVTTSHNQYGHMYQQLQQQQRQHPHQQHLHQSHQQQQQHQQLQQQQQQRQHSDQQHRHQSHQQQQQQHQQLHQQQQHQQQHQQPHHQQQQQQYHANQQQQRFSSYPSSSLIYTTPLQYSYTPPEYYSYTESSNEELILFSKLIEIFPEQEERVSRLLDDNQEIKDVEKLVEILLREDN